MIITYLLSNVFIRWVVMRCNNSEALLRQQRMPIVSARDNENNNGREKQK